MLAAIFVIPLLTLVTTAHAQEQPPRPTLLEAAREHGGITQFATACGPIVGLEDIVTKSSLIIHGTVVAVEPRLSPDGSHVLTDYQVQPIAIVFDNVTATPQVLQTPVFTARGGTMVVEGLQIADIVEHNGRQIMLNVGDEVVAMGAVENKSLMLYPTGVFTVAGGAVNANGTVEGFEKDGPGVPLDQFIARVLTLTARD